MSCGWQLWQGRQRIETGAVDRGVASTITPTQDPRNRPGGLATNGAERDAAACGFKPRILQSVRPWWNAIHMPHSSTGLPTVRSASINTTPLSGTQDDDVVLGCSSCLS
jgi:hypothetical protein